MIKANNSAFILPAVCIFATVALSLSRLIVTPNGFIVYCAIILLILLGHLILLTHADSWITKLKRLGLSLLIVSILVTTTFLQRTLLLGIEVYYIPTNSMKPSIEVGDIVIADLLLDNQSLKEGDIVIFNHKDYSGMDIIKRIKRIDNERYYLIGDNAKNSLDSRALGLIEASAIKGKATFAIRDFDVIRF
jgi:signal peptidase I